MADPAVFVDYQRLIGFGILIIFIIFAVIIWHRAERNKLNMVNSLLPLSLFAYSTYYMVYGFMVKGFFYRSLSISDSDALYIPVLLCALILWFIYRKKDVILPIIDSRVETEKMWILITVGVILMFVIITLISINMHPGLPGFHERFK